MRLPIRFCGCSAPRLFGRRLAPVLAAAFTAAVLGCGEEAQSPNPQAPTVPALATGAAAKPLAFRQISAGDTWTCGVTTDDRAYCWGLRGTVTHLTPAPVSGGFRFLEVSYGRCGVTKNQRVYCWGPDLVPVVVGGGRRFRQVGAGAGYACAVTPADVAFCWGENDYGQLGNGSRSFSPTPVRVAGGLRFRRVFAAATHTCGSTTDDRAYCWGNNALAALGDGSTSGGERPRPVAVAGGLRFRQVKPGSGWPAGLNPPEFDTSFSCGVTTANRAYCWGGFAVLGAEIDFSATPVAVAGGHRFNFVHPGLFHACALTLSDEAFCWGSGQDGQLGSGDGFSYTPVPVAGGHRFVGLTVSSTGWHSCGVTADHRAYCWGENSNGQLGDGTRISRTTPVPVAPPGL